LKLTAKRNQSLGLVQIKRLNAEWIPSEKEALLIDIKIGQCVHAVELIDLFLTGITEMTKDNLSIT
jgi:hypothetical protein